MVRVSSEAAVESCRLWSEDYLRSAPSSPIGAILLIQPNVVTDLAENTTSIVFDVRAVPGAALTRWMSSNSVAESPLDLCAFVGQVVTTPTLKKLVLGEGEFELADVYSFQRGDLYVDAKPEPGGQVTGELHQVAEGVFVHSVFSLLGKTVSMAGRFPPSHDLFIL